MSLLLAKQPPSLTLTLSLPLDFSPSSLLSSCSPRRASLAVLAPALSTPELRSDIDLPPWLPPKQTKEQGLEWAPLHTLDLSRVTISGDHTNVPDDVVRDVGRAFNTIGFIYAVDHGLTYGELLRQFAIGQYLLNNVSDEDKEKYRARIREDGSFVGYKQQGKWQLDGVLDRVEQCEWGARRHHAHRRADSSSRALAQATLAPNPSSQT